MENIDFLSLKDLLNSNYYVDNSLQDEMKVIIWMDLNMVCLRLMKK